MKTYLAGIIIALYILVFAVTSAIAWNPTNDYLIVVREKLDHFVTVAGAPHPKLVFYNSTDTVIVESNGTMTIIKGLIPNTACSLGDNIAVAGSYKKNKTIILAPTSAEPKIINYRIASQPKSCYYDNYTNTLVVLNTDPVAKRILIIADLRMNEIDAYLLPYNLSNPHFVIAKGDSIIIGGDNTYMIYSKTSGNYILTKYETPENTWIRFYGGLFLGDKLFLYGAIQKISENVKTSYQGFILDTNNNSFYLVKWKNAKTIVHALYSPYKNSMLRALIEAKGKAMLIVDLDPATLKVLGSNRVASLAPYILDKVGSTDDYGWIAGRYYINGSFHRVVHIVTSRNNGVLGFNESLSYALLLKAESPTITIAQPYDNMSVFEGKLKLSLSGLDITPFNGEVIKQRGDIILVHSYVDRVILGCSLFAVTAVFLVPVYYAIRQYNVSG